MQRLQFTVHEDKQAVFY